MGLHIRKRLQLQAKFRELFEQRQSHDAMSVALNVSKRTLVKWTQDLHLERPRRRYYNTAHTRGAGQQKAGRNFRVAPHCDHLTFRCDCIPPAKGYKDILRDS